MFFCLACKAVQLILHYLGEGGIYLMVCGEFEGRKGPSAEWATGALPAIGQLASVLLAIFCCFIAVDSDGRPLINVLDNTVSIYIIQVFTIGR